MYRFALAALICVAALLPASAQLPEDGHKGYVVIVDSPHGSPAGRSLEKLLESPELRPIVSKMHRHAFSPDSRLYQERYAKSFAIDTLPILAFVRPDGGVLYKASGTNVPTDAKWLAEELQYRINLDRSLIREQGVEWSSTENDCPGGRCPLPNQPQPTLPNVDELIPDSVSINPTVEVPQAAWWIGGGVMLLILIGGVGLLLLLLLGAGLFALAR